MHTHRIHVHTLYNYYCARQWMHTLKKVMQTFMHHACVSCICICRNQITSYNYVNKTWPQPRCSRKKQEVNTFVYEPWSCLVMACAKNSRGWIDAWLRGGPMWCHMSLRSGPGKPWTIRTRLSVDKDTWTHQKPLLRWEERGLDTREKELAAHLAHHKVW